MQPQYIGRRALSEAAKLRWSPTLPQVTCQDTDTNNKAKKCIAKWQVVNGKTAGPLTVTTYDF